MVTIVRKLHCTVYVHCVNVLLLAFAVLVQVKNGNPSPVKNTSELSSFGKELRWLIERVHPMSSNSNQYSFPKSSIVQSRKSRNAFSAARDSLRRHFVKRSKDTRDREVLKNITLLIKEKEDASLVSNFCSPSIDLVFVMDGCGRRPFHVCRDFVKDTIKKLKASSNNTRVGVIMYSKKVRLLFGFNYFTNIQDMLHALDSIRFQSKQPGKPENIGAALTKAHKMLFTGSRTGVPQVLILIAGARANDDIIKPAQRLQQDGVVIYSVGFGNRFDRSQLEAISSKPIQEHVFAEDRRLLKSLSWAMMKYLCRGETYVVKEGYIQRYQGPANVIFLLDGSGDIGFKELQFYKRFVKAVYNNIHIPPAGVKLGLLECGTRHYSQENILTRTFQSSKVLDLTLDNLVPMNGNCELGKSLQMINLKIFKRLPDDAPKALVVVLAGKPVDDATSAASELGEKGARIVALGAGRQADMKQLVNIADSPLYAFKVPAFKYLPSMSSTVVGFVNEVTEPKYVSNSISSPKAATVSKETQTGYHNKFGGRNSNDIDRGSIKENSFLSGLRPILSELDGEDTDSWSFLLQGGDTQLSSPQTTQDLVNSETLQASEGNNWQETPEENYNKTAETQNAMTEQEGFQLQDSTSNNAQSLFGNNSTSQGPENQSQDNNISAKPGTSSQSGSSVNPTSQTNNPTSTQVNSNQGNGSKEAVTSPNAVVGSKNGGGGNVSPGGTTSTNTGNTGVGSNNGGTTLGVNSVGGNQGSGIPVVVTLPGGGVAPSNGGSSVANGGISGGPTGNAAGAPGNPGQQAGPVQVIQTQLLPVPVLPIQTIPIQALAPMQLPQAQVPGSNSSPGPSNPQQPETNQSRIPQGGNNEAANNPNETNPSTGPATKEANKAPKGQETSPGGTKTPNVKPTVPNSGSGVTPDPAAKRPLPLASPAPETPPEGTNSSNASNPNKQKNAHTNTPSPQNKGSTTPKPTNTSSLAPNKPTSDSSAVGGQANVNSSTVKPNSATSAKQTQKPQIVLCQIVCGSDCCPPKLKFITTEPTVTTPKTSPSTPPPTSAKSELKLKPTAPPEVIAAPPVPMRYPQHPGWFPQVDHPMPIGPISGPLASSSHLPMYMTLPPATASPAIQTQEEKKLPVLVGQCQDYHPDCPSFVMSGMCDEEAPFKDAFNVREVCMLSCGVCNSFIKQGEKVNFDTRDKGKKPEDIGFPEYSKKFLKRQVREAHKAEDTSLKL